jgi:peptidoglycan/xylan/chitin deacetylase (PgdA/CDA1 family)
LYLKTIPNLIQRKLSKAVWSLPGRGEVYLTFDDGPSARTEELLHLLSENDAKASFFLLGENIQRWPKAAEDLRKGGHFIGNHGQKHLDGWKTGHDRYVSNAAEGASISKSRIFRPPYGRMTPGQWRSISNLQEIVMWSIMPGDFDSSISAEQCLRTVKDNVEEGSIIVLHDNDKSMDKVVQILPGIVKVIKEKGLRSEALPFKS